mmetsp:Transcript_34796/g.83213  ORF Transcript_34796/g.83213 Transcript_34796/m.83213 type:complete len:85 (-) Transcript_34796:492-746(-)
MDSGARLMNMNERGRLNLSKFIMVLICKLSGQEAVPVPELVGDANSPQSLYDLASTELVRPPHCPPPVLAPGVNEGGVDLGELP